MAPMAAACPGAADSASALRAMTGAVTEAGGGGGGGAITGVAFSFARARAVASAGMACAGLAGGFSSSTKDVLPTASFWLIIELIIRGRVSTVLVASRKA